MYNADDPVFDLMRKLKEYFPALAGSYAPYTGGLDTKYILQVLDDPNHLREARRILDEKLKILERAEYQARYDASMRDQWLTVNEARVAQGKKPVTFSAFISGVLEFEEE